jgi:hypothetical protein
MPHVTHKPHPSPSRGEQGHDQMAQSSKQAQSIHEQVPSQEVHEREDEDVPEWEVRNKVPIKIRPVFVPMKDVTSIHKWYAHDQLKPEN